MAKKRKRTTKRPPAKKRTTTHVRRSRASTSSRGRSGPPAASSKRGRPDSAANGSTQPSLPRSGDDAVGPNDIRVRMYRVGFGDFFLLSLQTRSGLKHILIDCGVHAGDLHSISAAVEQMAEETGKELALVIMTHRHADHISGFRHLQGRVQPVRRRTNLDVVVRGSNRQERRQFPEESGHGGGADEDSLGCTEPSGRR